MGRYDGIVTDRTAQLPGDFKRQATKPNKHRAVKVVVDGYKFASKMEAERYGELKLLQQAGEICELTVHPSFVVCPAVVRPNYRAMPAAKYIADFEYWEGRLVGHRHVVEYVKEKPTRSKWSKQHVITPVYRLKRQLFLSQYPDIEFREIRKGK